jgi:hypothetical protein
LSSPVAAPPEVIIGSCSSIPKGRFPLRRGVEAVERVRGTWNA